MASRLGPAAGLGLAPAAPRLVSRSLELALGKQLVVPAAGVLRRLGIGILGQQPDVFQSLPRGVSDFLQLFAADRHQQFRYG